MAYWRHHRVIWRVRIFTRALLPLKLLNLRAKECHTSLWEAKLNKGIQNLVASSVICNHWISITKQCSRRHLNTDYLSKLWVLAILSKGSSKVTKSLKQWKWISSQHQPMETRTISHLMSKLVAIKESCKVQVRLWEWIQVLPNSCNTMPLLWKPRLSLVIKKQTVSFWVSSWRPRIRTWLIIKSSKIDILRIMNIKSKKETT